MIGTYNRLGRCAVTLRLRHLTVLIVALLTITACSGEKTPTIVVVARSATEGAKVPTRNPTIPVTNTPAASATPTDSTPFVQVIRPFPVRQGPDLSYPVVTNLEANQPVEIIGISEDFGWYQVLLPDGTSAWLTTNTAMVTTSGNVAAVAIALAPTNTPTETATPTATETPTNTPSPTPTATETPIPSATPTSTLTETASPTSTLRPSPTPVAVPRYIADALAIVDIPQESGFVAAESRSNVIDLTTDDNSIRWSSFDPVYTDFVIGTSFQWGPGATEDYCGFTFRERIDNDETNTFYAVHLDRNGNLWFGELFEGAWGENIYGNGDFINTDVDDPNELILVAEGNTFSVYVNGQYSAQFTDETLTEGKVGIMGGTLEGSEESTCTFSNTFVYNLDLSQQPETTLTGEGTPIAYEAESTANGTIGGNNTRVSYTFTGTAGDVVSVAVIRTSGDLDPLVILLDPNGNEIARNDDTDAFEEGPTRDAAIFYITLPVDGEYTIIATRYQEEVGLTEGDFRIVFRLEES
jgi:hypothetical protein